MFCWEQLCVLRKGETWKFYLFSQLSHNLPSLRLFVLFHILKMPLPLYKKREHFFIFPHPLTVHLFVVVEKMPHLILSCEVQGSFRLKCSSYKEELGTPVFLTVNKIKTQGERDVIQQNILSASIAWQSISHLVKVWCFYSFCPGRPAARLQKNSCTHSPTFCSSCFILLKLFFVVERRHVANHDTTPHCI